MNVHASCPNAKIERRVGLWERDCEEWEGNADPALALNLKKKWDRTFPAVGPLMAAAKEAKKAKTALAGLADKSVSGMYG